MDGIVAGFFEIDDLIYIRAAIQRICELKNIITGTANQGVIARAPAQRVRAAAAAVENVAIRLEELHVDIRADRKETYQRLNGLEQRVAKLEATAP